MKSDMHHHDFDADNQYDPNFMEAMLERADYLRDKIKDEAWERSVEAAEQRKEKEGKP